MNDQLTQLIASVLATAVIIIFTKLYQYLHAKIGQSKSEKMLQLERFLEIFTETTILKIQQKFPEQKGELKAELVRQELKNSVGDTIKNMDINDAQLDLIVKRIYEYLRNQNFGGRFIQSIPSHTHLPEIVEVKTPDSIS